jgi:hypothetical protein
MPFYPNLDLFNCINTLIQLRFRRGYGLNRNGVSALGHNLEEGRLTIVGFIEVYLFEAAEGLSYLNRTIASGPSFLTSYSN